MSDTQVAELRPGEPKKFWDLPDILAQGFDDDFYLAQYPEVKDSGLEPVDHYVTTGWQQGLDPCPAFSTAYYLATYQDIRESDLNPFYHYLKFGRQEGRWPMPPDAGGLDRARLRAILEPVFDAEFYLQRYSDIATAGLDPLDHYIDSGAGEGRIPGPDFDPDIYRITHGLSANEDVLYHYAVFGRYATDRVLARNDRRQSVISAIAEAIRPEFHEEYYLNTHPDVAESGLDPVRHYAEHGWREGRNPHPHFNTVYYLDTNPDVKSAGLNPFWHYIIRGRAEHRRAVPEGGYKWEKLRALESLGQQVEYAMQSEPAELATPGQLLAGMENTLIGDSPALAVSVGHDDYRKETGGVQLCIAEEQVDLNSHHVNYLNIYPYYTLPVLSDEPVDRLALCLVLNDVYLGTARMSDVLTATGKLLAGHNFITCLVFHTVHGHSIDALVALHRVLAPEKTWYWIHDYFSICPGYNLLRNDVAYCHAPDAGSTACSICIYGEERPRHIAEHERLFGETGCEFIAPSRFAKAMWVDKTSWPRRDVIVAGHRQLVAADGNAPVRTVTDSAPLKVGFPGYPILHKGWPVFESLADRFGDDDRYAFYHLGLWRKYNRYITHVEVRTTGDRLDAMSGEIGKLGLDVVLLPSIWPETFSLTAHEALSAGCFLLTCQDSGNIAALVGDRDCGMVYGSERELQDWFESGAVAERARTWQRNATGLRLVTSGVTVPLILEACGV